MRLSIRNQLDATIDAVTRGEVMGTVNTRLTGGQHVTAAITLDAIDGAGPGDAVTVLVKATEVSIAVE